MKTFKVSGDGYGELYDLTFDGVIKASNFRDALAKFLDDETIKRHLPSIGTPSMEDYEFEGGILVKIDDGRKNKIYIIRDGKIQEGKPIGELEVSPTFY